MVCTAGVGDLDELISADVGALVREHDEAAYRVAARHIRDLLAVVETRERCTAIAEARLSLTTVGIPRYEALYQTVAL